MQSNLNSNGGLNSNGDFYAAVEGGSIESMKQSMDRQRSINQSIDKLDKMMINSRGSLHQLNSRGSLHNPIMQSTIESNEEESVYQDHF